MQQQKGSCLPPQFPMHVKLILVPAGHSYPTSGVELQSGEVRWVCACQPQAELSVWWLCGRSSMLVFIMTILLSGCTHEAPTLPHPLLSSILLEPQPICKHGYSLTPYLQGLLPQSPQKGIHFLCSVWTGPLGLLYGHCIFQSGFPRGQGKCQRR